ncbi:MAG: InlB B-repeat-containing protein, partial [Lachnospiraceae bacterium]
GELSNYYYVDYQILESQLDYNFFVEACGEQGPDKFYNMYEKGFPYFMQWIGIRDDKDIVGNGVTPNGYSKGNGYNFAGSWGYWLPICGIKAVVKPYNLTITVNPNGGVYRNTTEISSWQGESNSQQNIGVPSRTGYHFKGWQVSQTPLASTAANGNQLPDHNRTGNWGANYVFNTGNENVTFSALWEPWQHTVAYDANGGTGAPSPQIKTYGAALKLSSQIPTRTGFQFQGWGTSQDAASATYQADGWYGADQDGGTVTLYALWKPVPYQIQFEGNGATSGSTDSMNCTFGKAHKLNANGFKKEYQVTYDGNGGKSEKDRELAGAPFQGWLDENVYVYDGGYFNSLAFHAPYYLNKHVDVRNAYGYNKYEAIRHWFYYSIANDFENRQSSPYFKIDYYMKYAGADLKQQYGSNRLLYVSHFQLYGYEEGRKGTDAEDTVTARTYPDQSIIASLGSRDQENVKLKASWSPAEITLPQAERPGYQFLGWYTQKVGGSRLGTAGDSCVVEQAKTLYAQWKPITYTIQFDGNGATSGSMESVPAIFDQKVTLPENKFGKTGYEFTGWNTTNDGTGTTYQNQEEVKNLTTQGGTVITLYAQWKPITYTIQFDGNGATSGSMEEIPVTYEQPAALPENGYVRETAEGESIFLGWTRTKTSQEPEFPNQAVVNNLTTENGAVIVFYAVWDDCPQIESCDRYFTLDYAKAGKITEEELLRTAAGTDREDSTLENRTSAQVAEQGLPGSLSLYGYATTDFTQLTDDAEVSMTYRAVDSAGNKVSETVTVHITNTAPQEPTEVSYTRFINEKYYHAPYEEGGLHSSSIWRINPIYQEILKQGLDNLKNDTPEWIFTFTEEEILQAQEFISKNGIGKLESSDALQQFYNTMMEPNMQ